MLRIFVFEVFEHWTISIVILFLYWFFPSGSQSSQIIYQNCILEFSKNFIKPPSLQIEFYKISPVCPSICLSIHLWCIFLQIYLVDFLNFFCMRTFCHSVSPAKFIRVLGFISSKSAQTFIFYYFCSDFMVFWVFQGMVNFSSYEDFLNIRKQYSEILKFAKPWMIFP